MTAEFFLQRSKASAMVIISAGIISMLGACGVRFTSTAPDHSLQDPYLEFSNAVAEVEPLINPELDALTGAMPSEAPFSNHQPSLISLPTINPLDVEGDTTIVSESTLLSLNEQMYQHLINLGFTGIIDLKSMSVSQAIREFCDRKTVQLLTIKRALSNTEQQYCRRQGRQPLAFPIAKDALLLIVNQQDQFIKGVTLDTLKAILTQKQWSGVVQGWPQVDIHREIIGPDSSSVDVLAQALFEGNQDPVLTTAKTNFFVDVESLVQSMTMTPHSVSFMSHSIYQTLPQRHRVIPINGISGSPKTIQSGLYPLHQTVYLYIDQQQFHTTGRTPSTPSLVHALSNLYLTHVNQVLSDVSLLPLPATQLNQSVRQWLKSVDNQG